MSFHQRTLAFGLAVFLAFAALAGAQTWTPLAHQPTFSASTALLLTDGTVMVQAIESNVWWRLTPDSTGSYINGTWSQLASMPTGYNPLYFASAVLPDGRVVVEGGEYNGGNNAVETNLGAIYNPVTNAWTSIAPPSGVTQIGDASGTVLANGTFMLGPCCFQITDYLLNASTLTWTATGSAGKADVNAEETWTLLPNGNILTVDTQNGTNSEVYNPSTGGWTSAGSTIVQLPFSPGGFVPEIGPAVLRPNGTVFATGATSNTAIYNPATGTWSAGPAFPNGLDIADGPAALLPNGNVLVDTSPGVFQIGARFFEFNGTSLVAVPAPPRAPNQSSYEGRMLVLPTGQVLFTDGSTDVEVYTAAGTYQNAWRPTINSFPSTVTPGVASYSISGTQLNGLSEGSSYGDDAQSATNYPLVRVINNATGHVFYARTHNHSRMGVASGGVSVSTLFDVPAGIETGASLLEVVANGIPSFPVSVYVAVPVNYAGNLDHAGCDTIAGWAADDNRLNTSINVSIYNNGVLLTTVLANASRPDVGAYLGDNGLHGFSITTPLSLQDGSAHQVSVRFESSSTNLSSSPVSLTCSAPPAPVANFSFNCTTLSCSFNGTSSVGTGLTYAWTFGDSGTGSGSAPNHTYGADGGYTVTLTVTDPWGRQSSVSKTVTVTSNPFEPAHNYFAVAPCRVLDTRNTTILTNAQSRVVNIAGLCGIPSTAKAVAFNVTAVSPTGSGKFRFYPGNVTVTNPNIWLSSLTFVPATSPRANSAVVKLATNGTGTLGIYPEVAGSPGQAHLILDVQGYFSTDTSPAPGAQGPLGFQTLSPCRVAWPSTPLTAGTVTTFTAQGVCGIPVGAAVASLHAGVAQPASSGYLTLFPSNIATPGVSTLNFTSGISVLRNSALVKLSPTTPDFSAYFGSTAGATAQVHFDVNGYFKSDAPLKYHPLTTPCRSVNAALLTTDTVRTFQIQGNCGVPVGAKAALVRLQVANPTSSGDITVYPSNLPLSAVAVSTVKFDANEPSLSMGTIVQLSTLADDLAISPGEMTAGGTVVLSVDVFGYFQ